MRKKPTYTEKVHARRLLLMLDREDPCLCCPAQRQFKQRTDEDFRLWANEDRICYICQRFVCIGYGCPCSILGKQRALKRTRLALEEKGYT